LAQERADLAQNPEQELAELTAIDQAKGLSATAPTVAAKLTAHGGLPRTPKPNFISAQMTWLLPCKQRPSALSFTLGAFLPLLAILLPPATWRVPVTFVSVLIALAATGAISTRIGGSNPRRAVIRVVIGGAAGLALTYCIGRLFGTAVS
jgi:VIT1/CCC1 family predicted Fe2+/Mn2+ transporter